MLIYTAENESVIFMSSSVNTTNHRPESWLIPCSPSIYDVEGAFEEYGSIIWHQDCNISAGDYAYIYVTAPVKEIRYKCLVAAVNIPCDNEEDDGYVLNAAFCSRSHRRYMELKLIEEYSNPFLSYQMLLRNGLSSPIRSQRRAAGPLLDYIITSCSASDSH